MIHSKLTTMLPIMVLTLTSLATAADTDSNILKNSGSLDRLFKQSGVYNASPTGKTPGFVADPAWPQWAGRFSRFPWGAFLLATSAVPCPPARA